MFKFKKLDWLGGSIIIIATFLRLYRLNAFVTFLGDQGRDAIIMKRIMTFEHFPAIGAPSSIGQIYLGPFYYYLIAPFLFLFNYNPLGMAFGVALLSICGLIGAFYVIKREINALTSLIFLLLATFSAVHIELSRFSWNPNLLPIFSFFTLYFFYKVLTTKKLVYSILFGAFFSFSFQLHHLAGLLILPLTIVLVERLIKHKLANYHTVSILASVGSFLFFSVPLIVFDLRHDFLNTKNLIKLFTGDKISGSSSPLIQIKDTITTFFTHTFKFGINEYIAICLFIAILALLIYLYRKQLLPLLVFLNGLQFISFTLLFSLLNSPRYPHYFGSVYLSFFLFVSYVVSILWQKKLSYRYIVSLCIAVYILLNVRTYTFFFDKGSYQIDRARSIATSIVREITAEPYQLASLPATETDGHLRYFLEVDGRRPLSEDSIEQPAQLFVLCYEKECSVIANPQWQIANFKHATINNKWTVEGITVYKLIHEK